MPGFFSLGEHRRRIYFLTGQSATSLAGKRDVFGTGDIGISARPVYGCCRSNLARHLWTWLIHWLEPRAGAKTECLLDCVKFLNCFGAKKKGVFHGAAQKIAH